METFYEELRALINKHSRENNSDTPDYILANFMHSCLLAWEDNVKDREAWHGRTTTPSVSLSEAVEIARGGEAPTSI